MVPLMAARIAPLSAGMPLRGRFAGDAAACRALAGGADCRGDDIGGAVGFCSRYSALAAGARGADDGAAPTVRSPAELAARGISIIAAHFGHFPRRPASC